jgi:hypothetical protein
MVFKMAIYFPFVEDEICVAQGKYGTNPDRLHYAFDTCQR